MSNSWTGTGSALQLHSPLEALGTAGDSYGSASIVDRRSDYPAGPPDVLEGRAFLHRIATQELVNTYFRSPLDIDNLTGEIWEMRWAYRQLMLKEPAVKAALISKVQAVAALDPQMLPDDPDSPADKAAAKFVDWSLQRSNGGWPKVIENIVLPGLIDGFSVGEKGYEITRSSKYGGFWTFKKLYSCDTKHIRFDVDRFKEISRIRLIRTLPATALDPRDFVIFQHLQLFESPFGISDLRAAYRAAKFIESSIKLRAILLENFSGPFLKGKYPLGQQDIKNNMEKVLAKARSLGWVVYPEGGEIDVINLATSAPDQFQQTIDDLRKEIYTAIRGAYLPFTEAGSGVQRADTGVQKSITEIFEWWLASAACEVINRQIIPDLVRWNFGNTVGLPRCQLGGMNMERATKQLGLIQQVHQLTGNVSKKQVYDLTRVEPATDDEDKLQPPQAPGGAGPGGPGGGPSGSGGPGGDMAGLMPKGPSVAPDSANPQAPNLGVATNRFGDVGSALELSQEAPAGWPPAGDVEGLKLAAILEPTINAAARTIVNATKQGLDHSIPNYASSSLWTPEQRREVVESLAAMLAFGDMLARARLRQNQPGVDVKKFADSGASTAFDLFGASGDMPFSFLGRPPRAPSTVELAIDYIRSLVPIPGVDAIFLAQKWRRKAFTLAVDTEGVILDKVKSAVLGEVVGGEDSTGLIQSLLSEAGLAPSNPDYARMIARTNVMDAYNTGFHDTMQDPDVQADFPVWKYAGIQDGRQGPDHEPQFGHYFLASDDFATIRGPRPWNCRCLAIPVYASKWKKLQAAGAEIGPYPEWASGASAVFGDFTSALTPTNRLGSLLCVAADLSDEIRPERLRVVLGHLADNTQAYAAAIGISAPPPSRIFHGVYDETKHPRDDGGRWVDKADIASARVNSGKAAELRSKVTNPRERAKLDAQLGSNDPIATPPDRAKGKRLVAKARLGAATPDEQRDLFHHLPALSHEDLRDVRDSVESQPSQQTPAAIEHRGKLADHVRAASAGQVPMPEHPVFAAIKAEAAKSNLPPAKKAAYLSRMDSVLQTMPVAAQDRIAQNLQGVGFHGNAAEVGTAAIASAKGRGYVTDQEHEKIDRYKAAFEKGKLKPAAAYVPKAGAIHVDGGTEATYAHILGHAIDGPNKDISSSPGWDRAWHAEIAGKLSEDPKLNRYAQGNPHEGFAEFSRLVYGTETPAAAIEAKFPLASAVLKTNRLWHDTPRFHQPQAMPLEADAAAGDKPPEPKQPAAVDAPVKLPEVFGERVALDSNPGGAHVDALAASHNPETGTPSSPENQHVYTVPTKSLHVDPDLFQYKVAGIGAGGLSSKLNKVTKWDPNLGGVSLVWRDPETGKDYIVNGHHRHELAERVGQPTMNVRYINAKDSKEARSIGALANIAEGMGKAIDAAKWMRDTDKGVNDLKQAGVPVTGKMVQDASALVNLGQKSFDAVTQGRLDEDTAVAVAKHLKDPELQDALFAKVRAREAAGNDWTPRQIELAAKKLATAGKTATSSGGDLFGDVPGVQSTFDQEMDLEDFANRKLAQSITDYGAVGNRERAGRVAEAGNELNLAENAKRRRDAQDTQENFDKFARLKSNTSATIREYAAKLAAVGEHGSYVKKNAVRDEFYERIKQAVADDLTGKPAPNEPLPDPGSLGASGGAEPQAAGAGGAGVGAGADTAAGRSETPGGAGGEVAASLTEDGAHAEGETSHEDKVSALLEPSGAADAPTQGERPAGTDDVLRDVDHGEGSQVAVGRGGDHAGAVSAADGEVAGAKAEPAGTAAGTVEPEKPITTHFAGEDGEIDKATQHRAREQYPELLSAYLKKGMGTLDADGKLNRVTLNTDEWRDLFPEYKGTNSYAVHEASSYLNKKLFEQALKETAGKPNNTMLILAGGGGSGKGTAVKDYIDLSDYPLTLDQVSDNYTKLKAKMDEAEAHGFHPQYVFIDRHPSDAWTHGVVRRAANAWGRNEIARTVPLEVALKANLEARKTAIEYLKKNPDADATVIDNNHGHGKARVIEDRDEAIKFLEAQDSAHNYEELHGRLQRDTLDLHESGGLPADLAEGLVGREAIHARRAQSGRSEEQRAARTDGRGAEGAAAGTGSESGGAAGIAAGSAGAGAGGETGEERAALADPNLRRHSGEKESGSDHLAAIQAIPEGKSAVINGVEVRHGSGSIYSATIDGKSVVDVADGIAKRVGETKEATKGESAVSDETKTAEPETNDLGGGFQPVGNTDWHKSPSGELVHAPTLKKTRKTKGANSDEKPSPTSSNQTGSEGASKGEPDVQQSQGDGVLPQGRSDAAAGGAPADATDSQAGSSRHVALAQALAAKLKNGGTIDKNDLFDAADKAHGGSRAQGKYQQSEAYDALETAVNLSLAGQTNPTAGLDEAKAQAQKLSEMVKRLPTQTNRTGNKDTFQQFSTPPHYAFAATWLANLKPGESVLEPSAGTGSIAVHAQNAGAKVIANELDPTRADLLKHQFGSANVHTENAEQISKILPKRGVSPDVVVMNPPFSSTAGRTNNKDILTASKHIDEALRMLPEGGRLVAIVGEGMTNLKGKYKDWFDKIQKEYGLKANVGVAGEEYAKYGTTFGSRLLVIDKDGPTRETVTGDVKTIPDLMEKLKGVRDARPAVSGGPAQQPPGQQAGAANPPAGGAVGQPGQPLSGSASPSLAGSDAGQQPGKVAAARRTQGSVDPNVAATAPAGAHADGGPGIGGGGIASQPAADAGDFVPPGADLRNDGRAADAGARRGSAGGTAAREPRAGVPKLRPAASVAVSVASPEEQKSARQKTIQAAAANSVSPDGAKASEDNLYERYTPSKLRITDAQQHPSALVESSAMSSVELPDPTYSPKISPDVIAEGRLTQPALESVVYAGQNHETFLDSIEGQPASRRGYFIGDGTGAGKGRQISGIVMDNMANGRKKHVWVSKSFELLEDAQRDWRDTGNDPDQIFNYNKIGGEKPPEDGVAFISYGTLAGKPRNRKDAPPNIDTLCKWLGPDFDGVIAFDESHMMANGIATEGGRGGKKPSLRALAGIELQRRLPNARIVYSSATGATEVTNLAYADRLGLWGTGTSFPDKRAFFGAMQRGGVAAMEAVAQSMKSMGLYSARSLSMDDGTPHGKVEYDRLTHTLTPDQRQTYDAAAETWQNVLANIDKAVEVSGATGMEKAAAYSQFWGGQQRFFNQLMTSMQTESVVKDIEKQLAAGNAPVIQLVNTMKASMDRAIDAKEEGQEYEDIDVSPRDILANYLSKSFPTGVYEDRTDADGNTVRVPVKDSQGNSVEDPKLVAMRDEMLDKIGGMRMPESPIDRIINYFGHENVAEATGRDKRLVAKFQDDGSRKMVLESRAASANSQEARDFQDGKKKIMIFSDAGGTGKSYHSDRNAKNQARRIHYMLQPGWRADAAVQGLGRTHRTNQANAPLFRLVEIGELKAQRRFVSTIARRLDQLGALTRGQRQAGSSGLFKATDNLESAEAGKAIKRFFKDLKQGGIQGMNFTETMRGLGFRPNKDGDYKEESVSIPQFLNRLLSLKIDQQGKVFDEFDHRLQRTVEEAMAAGDLDTGVENYPASKLEKTGERSIHREPRTGAEAKIVTAKAQRKLEKNAFPASGSLYQPRAYVQSARTGTIYAVYDTADRTDDDGNVASNYRLKSVTNGVGEMRERHTIDRALYTQNGDAGNWKHLKEPAARKLWEKQHAEAPNFEESDQHFVTGAILPIWDKLPKAIDKPKIYKLKLSDGTQTVGLHIPGGQIYDGFLTNLGIDESGQKKELETSETHAKVAQGTHRAQLANGWSLVPARVQDERRIELIGPGIPHFNELQGLGAKKERINYATRWFIPTGDEGIDVLKRITKNRPIVSERAAKE